MDARNFMKYIKLHVVLTLAVVTLSLIFATSLGNIYEQFLNADLDGSLLGDGTFWGPIIGFPLGIIFFASVLFTAWGEGLRDKWGWGLLALPVIFEVVFDFSHLYFPILLGLVGYGVGWVIRKLLKHTRRDA